MGMGGESSSCQQNARSTQIERGTFYGPCCIYINCTHTEIVVIVVVEGINKMLRETALQGAL